MIESVNSVLSNAPAVRNVVEQQSSARSVAANPQKVQEAATNTPYVSPYISLDRSSNRAVLQIRDSDTGDVLQQYPTKTQLKAYQNAQEISQKQERAVERGPTAEQAPSIAQSSEVKVPEVTQQEAPSVETEA